MITFNLVGIYNHGNGETAASITGDVLSFDGVEYDLSLLGDGDTATDITDYLTKIERVGSDYFIDAIVKYNRTDWTNETVEVTGDWVLDYIYEAPQPESEVAQDDLA